MGVLGSKGKGGKTLNGAAVGGALSGGSGALVGGALNGQTVTDGKFSPFGLGKGSHGSLGEWDVIGNGLDRVNPYTSTDDGTDEDAKAAALQEMASHGFDGLAAPEGYHSDKWLGDYEPVAKVDPGSGTRYRDIDASLANVSTVDGTAYDDIEMDPRLRESQTASLDSLDDIIAHGGRSAKEEADLQRTLSDVAAQDRGRRDAILQRAQQTGTSGGGMELLAQLQSSQAAADRANQSGLDINADAEQRALDAIMQRGTLAGNIRGQDYGEQANRASAADAIAQFNSGATNANSQFNAGAKNSTNEFNASNRLANDQYNKSMAYDASKTNVGYANDAAQYNHAGKQAVASGNTAAANTAQQQQFQNQMDLANAKTGAAKGYADYVGGVGDRKAKENAEQKKGILGGVGSVVGTLMSDERSKKDVQEASPEEIEGFLAALAPKRFRYKDGANGAGNRVGVMAQDLEGSSIGRDIVHEDEDGAKRLDTNNLLGAIVAGLAHLNQKVGK